MSKKRKKALTPNAFNKIIDEAINALADENFDLCAEGLEELAHLMKSAGVNQAGFKDMVAHVGSQAARNHPDPRFLDEKLKIAVQDRAKKRGGIVSNIRIITPK